MGKNDLEKSIKKGHSSNRILQANESYTVEEKVLSALEELEDFGNDSSIEDDNWELVAKKTVTDSDGFLTEYTWYKNAEGVHIFMFGDSDMYGPDRDYADHECLSDETAKDWFDNYTGFDDDEDDYDSEDLEDTFNRLINADESYSETDTLSEEDYEQRLKELNIKTSMPVDKHSDGSIVLYAYTRKQAENWENKLKSKGYDVSHEFGIGAYRVIVNKFCADESMREAYKVTYKDKDGNYPSLIVVANSERDAINKVKQKGITDILEANSIDWDRAQKLGIDIDSKNSAKESIKQDERESTDKQPKEACAVEAGEWDDEDEESIAWKESLLTLINSYTDFNLDIKDIKGFDKYQGPYAYAKGLEFWTSAEDEQSLLINKSGTWYVIKSKKDFMDFEKGEFNDISLKSVSSKGSNEALNNECFVQFDPEDAESSGLKEGQEVIFDEDVVYNSEIDTPEELKDFVRNGILKIDNKTSFLIIPKGTEAVLKYLSGLSGGWPTFYFNNDSKCELDFAGDPFRLRIMNNPDEKFSTESYRSSDEHFNESQLEDALSTIDDCLYKIEDSVIDKLQEVTHIKAAHDALYQSFDDILKIIKKTGVGTKLIKKYNLED